MRLRSVRGKLTALVALPVLLLLLALPALSFLMHRELVDEIDDRLDDARRSLQLELDDDWADVKVVATALANDSELSRAIEANDAAAARGRIEPIAALHRELSIGVEQRDRTIATLAGAPMKPDLVAKGAPDEEACGPSRWLAARGSTGRAVIVCQPIDRAFLENAGVKLGLELATQYARTHDFPFEDRQAQIGTVEKPSLVERAGRSWAVARIPSPSVPGNEVIAALDVTDVVAVMKRHLILRMAIVLLIGIVAVAWGSRIAGTMSIALGRIGGALRRLREDDEYVHLEPLRTGDELEDLATGFNAMVDGLKERDKLRTTFGKYMTESVLEHLLAGKVQLGGVVLPVTVLFTDIRSFTSISERMDAQALVGLLNEYFTEMVGIVLANDGVVDKYIGDAIMAVFGAPVPRAPGEDAKNAVRAAVGMRRALMHLNERLAGRGLPPLRTGIGIHSGEVVAGNIGSERRMEYTVIGDAVNVASRLETATKELGVDILVSEATWELAKDVVEGRAMRAIQVKGRAQPVTIYELSGLREPLD